MVDHKQEQQLSSQENLFLEPYLPEKQKEWDDFIDTSRNGTIFHSQTFLSYHPQERFRDASVLIRDARGHLRAVLPASVRQENTGVNIFHSHPGSTYGGFVVARDFSLSDSLRSVALIEDHARSLGARAIELRHAEKIFQLLPSEELDFALESSGFRWCRRELSSALMIAGLTPETMLTPISARNRAYVKKALGSGIEVRLSDDYPSFHRMLTATLGTRHGTMPTHTLEEMERIRDLVADRVRLFAGFLHNQMVAGAWLIRCNAKATHTFYLAQDYAFEQLRPLRVVLHELIRWHIEQGYRYLNFGISTEDEGRIMNHGLFRFKESFGARGVIRTAYRKELD